MDSWKLKTNQSKKISGYSDGISQLKKRGGQHLTSLPDLPWGISCVLRWLPGFWVKTGLLTFSGTPWSTFCLAESVSVHSFEMFCLELNSALNKHPSGSSRSGALPTFLFVRRHKAAVIPESSFFLSVPEHFLAQDPCISKYKTFKLKLKNKKGPFLETHWFVLQQAERRERLPDQHLPVLRLRRGWLESFVSLFFMAL